MLRSEDKTDKQQLEDIEYRKKYWKYYKCSHCGAPSYLAGPVIHKDNCTNIKQRRKNAIR